MRDPPPVEDVLRHVAVWAGRSVAYRPIEGGLSHRIWRVDAGNRSYVLRVLDVRVSEAGLGIPPDQEIANTLTGARCGVGARVFEVLPQVPALVLEYLPGRTLAPADVNEPATVSRIAAACRRLHAGPAFGNDFDIVAKLHELLDVCRRHDLPVPDGYAERVPVADKARSALAAMTLPAVPCHNDLLAENFLDVAGEIRIVDYQLSGNNDPAFELGDIAAEADFDPDQAGQLAAEYFGSEVTPALVCRVRLNLMLSNFAWTLWFSIHDGLLRTADTGFDYAAEAADKWRQARRDLDAPELGRLLDAVAGRPRPRNRWRVWRRRD
ncbi:MAG TPA: phosphotransferase [Micromonosporaceae bacterium]|nr:phosphotransferase [Micromonosporaceae bacterium]